jgi:hypothetical protein
MNHSYFNMSHVFVKTTIVYTVSNYECLTSREILIFIIFLYFSKIGFVIAWIILIVLAYRVSLIETEHKEYDPFLVLDIDRVMFNMSQYL